MPGLVLKFREQENAGADPRAQKNAEGGGVRDLEKGHR